MARNKHPEETVDLILDASFRLFMNKGYEHTSIQDIINRLGGLSKGAIYHHFKSKEDILLAVTNRMTEESNRILAAICNRSDLNGKEKLKAILKESVFQPEQDDLFAAAPDLNKNPKLLVSILQDTVNELAPITCFFDKLSPIPVSCLINPYPKYLSQRPAIFAGTP